MKILVACEYSGVVRRSFQEKGHEVYSCDLLPAEDGECKYHLQCDVRDILNENWNMVIAHPSCQHLCNSGVRWLWNKDKSKNQERWDNLEKAREFFMLFYNHPCPRICIENPIPHKYAKLPIYSQTIQPYEHGHSTSKRTCLWLKGLPKLTPTKIIPKEQRTQDVWLESPGPNRWKNRSRTFEGIGKAFANQWG